MVASALFLVVLTLVFQLFLPALRAWKDGQKRSEVGQSLLLTSDWLGEDVIRSSPGSITLTPEGALVMKCAQGQTTDDSNPFNLMVGYWQEGSDLYRSTQVLSDPDAEVSGMTMADLAMLRDKRRVASGVTAFEVTTPQAWRVDLHLAVEREGRKGELRTGYASIYAPLDLEMADANASATPAAPISP